MARRVFFSFHYDRDVRRVVQVCWQLFGRCRLLLRLSAWMMHAMLDGVLIGSADQLAVIIPLSFAILVCAM